MNKSKMQDEEYVETSDVEELGDVYGPGRAPIYDGDVRMDWVHGRASAFGGNSQECEIPRKRRKLRHLTGELETGMQPSTPSHRSMGISRAVGSQATDGKSQIQHVIGASQMKNSKVIVGEKMDTGETPVPRSPSQPRGMPKINLNIPGTPTSQDPKAEASWATPQKLPGSRTDCDPPLPQISPQESQQQLAPIDYEGDLLNQFERSLSPQAFSLKSIPTQETRQFPQSPRLSQDESEDELAIIPPRSTSPLPTSQAASGTSEGNLAHRETPFSFLSSSPLSPVESVHSRAEDTASQARGLARESASPSHNSGTDGGDDHGIGRYPLRRRQPNQLRPYLYDEYQYKTVLKNNPAAIIDVLRLQKRRSNQMEDRYDEGEDYAEEESQQQTGDTNTETETQRERTKSPAEALPAFLDPLTESEDESDGLAEEARRVERELRRRQKEERQKERLRQREEQEERRKERQRLMMEKGASRKPKRFPMSNTPVISSRPNSNVSDNEVLPATQQSHRFRTPPALRTLRSPSVQPPPNGVNELDALRDYFMDDFMMSARDVNTGTVEPELPPEGNHPSPRKKTPEVIELDEDEPPAQESDSTSSTDSDQELSKQYRELFKLYPPGMARKLLERDKSQQRSRQSEPDQTEDTPLLPGQSRIRRAASPKDIRDIRGDSESDDSERERRSMSPPQLYNGDIRNYLDHEAPALEHTWNAPKTQKAGPSRLRSRHISAPPSGIIEISDGDNTSSSEELADEEDINILLGDDDAGVVYDADPGHGSIKEESMIDWMLSRTRIVGSTISKPKPTRRKGHPTRQAGRSTGTTRPSRSKYKLDITVGGARGSGNGRQARLSFTNHTSNNALPSTNDRPQAGIATEPIQIEIQDHDKRKSWKERRKERRERAKRQGIYSMANPNTVGITSGRANKAVKVTIDLDDDDFYQSFTPHPQVSGASRNDKGKARADPLPSQFDNQPHQGQQPADIFNPRQPPLKRSRHRIGQCTVDMRIETLNPGTVFNPTSFIREGYLHALLDALNPGFIAPRPDPTYLCGMNINPLMDLDAFLRVLDQIFDGLLNLTTDMPSDDYEEKTKDWTNLNKSACRHITWFYSQGDGEGRKRLLSWIKNKVLSIVSSLESREIPVDALDTTLLSLCWFCIETSVRSGHRLFGGSPELLDLNPVHASMRLILRFLFTYGLRKPYRMARKNQVLDDTKMPCYAAQIWVCLLHLLPTCDIRPSNDSPKENPLWSEVLSYYQRTPSTNTLETGENVWKTVFTLMALSQFSVLGIVSSNSRLSTSWSLVAHAIKQAQLAQNTQIRSLGQDALEKRDGYISIIILRCYHLLDYWKWKMDHSFGTLNQLVDIFRARNFVNLRHEMPEFPDFMLNRDWTSLSQLQSVTDSAFTSILKLAMRAVDSDCLSKAEIKKMVALIIPVSKFRTQKEAIPGVDDLSPICNRFAALALAIAIDPGYATRTVNQVHGSIDFAASDLSTQLLTIRGIHLLASLMIQKGVPLPEIAKWFTMIIGIAASEFRTLKSPGASVWGQQKEREDKIRKYSLLILSLYAAGRIIMETFAAKSQYPDSAFLLAFKPFLESDFVKAIEETNFNLCEMRRFFEGFLEARNKFLPLPQPVLPNAQVDDPESQDYGNFDFGIDFNDPTTLAQLDGGEKSFDAIRDKEKVGDLLQKIIFPFFWVALRKIQRFCDATVDSTVDLSNLRTLDSWAHCLVGCMYILIQHGTLTDWAFCLKEITPLWRSARLSWLKTRVQLVLYLEILRHHPTFYASKKTENLELLFTSFAIHDITLEPRFWYFVISQEITNPLFKDTAGTLSSIDAGSSPSDYKEIRLSLLRAVFGNVESGLQEMDNPSPHLATWIELCLRFFSAIRSNSQDFMGKPDLLTEYNAWSKEILALFETYPRLRHHQRLAVVLDLLL